MDDRRVHAGLGDEQVVRYALAGKWYIESGDMRFGINTRYAARRAVQLKEKGGFIHLGIPGGSAFDRRVAELS